MSGRCRRLASRRGVGTVPREHPSEELENVGVECAGDEVKGFERWEPPSALVCVDGEGRKFNAGAQFGETETQGLSAVPDRLTE